MASDPVKASALAKKSCELGYKGCSPPVSPEMAKQAGADAGDQCDAGIVATCAFAGTTRIESGDYAAAAGYFKRGCEAGHPPSCAQLATAHLLGRGVARDPVRAHSLYKKACDAGETSACDALKLTK